MNITLSEAVATAKEQGVTIGELEALGFEIDLSGTANVTAKETTPELPVNAELTAHVEALFEAGRKVKATAQGRAKRVLGDQDGISPYRVIVTKGK